MSAAKVEVASVKTTDEIIAMTGDFVMNTYGRLPLSLVRGEGTRVWDAEGREYLDFVSGIAVNGLGHCHPAVVEAIRRQAGTLIHCSNLYYIESQARLAKILVENSALDRVFFCNSGAEANEAAIKLARKWGKQNYGGERYVVITARQSFHGRTLATLTATAQEKYQEGFEPLPIGFRYVPFNDLEAMDRAMTSDVCAVLLEPVQGEGGVNLCDSGYLKGVRRLCDQRGALLILDEIQTGLGRTGKLFAHQHFGVEPDILTIAKSLGGGVPIGAMLAREKVASAFTPGSHASTFGGNPLATAAALAAMEALLGEGLVEHAARMGALLMEELRGLQDRHAVIRQVRGLGLMVGVELGKEGLGGEVVAACQRKGVLVNSVHGNVIRLLPPLIVEEHEIKRVVAVFGETLSELGM
ncbi:MAG: acetylornithine transaminase [Firmicutes bacterium]|nr:acetylornithine transaminase [Bacillota bacterium]